VRAAPAGGGATPAGGGGGRPVVLHVAPHPDDELIGSPAALMALRDAGWSVVNLTCSLGAPGQQGRRRSELAEACRRAGFVSEVIDEPLGDPLGAGEVAEAGRRLRGALDGALARHRPVVVVSPSPHDRHRGHEVVGRAVVSACAAAGQDGPGRLWLWGLWADLPFVSLLVGFDERRLKEILAALEAHGGEIERNDYRRLVRGRAEMHASLGPERAFGFGGRGAGPAVMVEALAELGRRHGSWVLGRPRWFDPSSPLGELGDVVLDEWLASPSVTERYGAPG
jgi:LmbE family N-acetylglucosaminyl deacetylase